MVTLTITQGFPGSGKSFWAKEQVNKLYKTTVRVNRDDLRAMLFNDICLDMREEAVTIAQEAQVMALLLAGKNVIVDDTNLNQKIVEAWLSIVFKANAEYQERYQDFNRIFVKMDSKSFLDVPIETCIERDSKREVGRVGRSVIEGMALKMGRAKFDKEQWAIFDMDGTLADISWRGPFEYHKVSQDPTRHSVLMMLLEAAHKGMGIIILSGRANNVAGIATEQWLTNRGIPFDHIFMRRAKDQRKDTEVKKEILDGILKYITKEQIKLVVDDRPCVLRLWEEEFKDSGTEIRDVGNGIEF